MRSSQRSPSGLAAVALLSGAAALPGTVAAVQTGPTSPAEAPGWGSYQAPVEASREILRDLMLTAGVPGISVAVGLDGQVVWSEGLGWADVESRVPVWAHTRFRIASISKALTAGAVARLHEQGRLDLDVPVQRYVPSFPIKEKGTVTTRLLAGHLAGVRHYRDEEFLSRARYEDVVDALEIFRDDPLEHAPGTAYLYSTYGWSLVSAVVQGAADAPFLEHMSGAVLEPLGMYDTVAEHADSIILHRARYYRRGEDGRLVNAPWVDNSNKWAGGGYLSTARDLVTYGMAYLGGDFLSPETMELLFTPQTMADGTAAPYGIGWRIDREGVPPAVYHTGGAVGASAILLLYPEERVAVSVLTNLEGLGDRRIRTARTVADLFVDVLPREDR